MLTSTNHYAQINVGDIRRLNGYQGVQCHQGKSAEDSLQALRGNFIHRIFHGGLSIHGGDITELTNLHCCTELPPGLSFNLIFSGSVEFTLAGRPQRIGSGADPDTKNLPECSVFALKHPEFMTRKIRRGNRLCKLNLFVERGWLLERCCPPSNHNELGQLFSAHGELRRWTPSKDTLETAKALMSIQGDDFSSSLEAESLAITLLSDYLGECLIRHVPAKAQYSTPLRRSEADRLKQVVDNSLESIQSLPQLATTLNISVSTLQRRFKASYGISVIEYLRQRRLELARSAMIERGLSISEAAYLAGYRHASNFVTAFRKQFKITPAEMIKAHRG